MSATAISLRPEAPSMSAGKWIYNKKWDLAFISLSIVLVPVPYLTWLFMKYAGVESETGRQAVNLLIAGLIGGPHMYATFTRAALDQDFTPITDQQASAAFRREISHALLRKALIEAGGTPTRDTRVIEIRETADASA